MQNKKDLIESIIRVNHAGEYGAKRIYEGQLAFLKDDADKKEVQHMLDQELEHLETFEKMIQDRKVRPTALMPLWHVGGFAMGAITALMGTKSAYACTVAVESVIGEHYESQENKLKEFTDEKKLLKTISKFKQEELEHHDKSLNNGAEDAILYQATKTTIQAITKTAIAICKKI